MNQQSQCKTAPINDESQSVKPTNITETSSIISVIGLPNIENAVITGYQNVTNETDFPRTKGSSEEFNDPSGLSLPSGPSTPVPVPLNPRYDLLENTENPFAGVNTRYLRRGVF